MTAYVKVVTTKTKSMVFRLNIDHNFYNMLNIHKTMWKAKNPEKLWTENTK